MNWLETVFKFTSLQRFNTLQPQLENNQLSELQCDDRGQLLVSIDGGGSLWQDTLPAATERVVKSTAGRLFQLVFFNTSSESVYIYIFDHPTAGAGRPANGGLPLFLPILIPPNAQAGITLQRPRRFASGIYWGASSSPVSFQYKNTAALMSTAEYS